MDDRERACLEETVERLWNSGMGDEEIAQRMGVDPVWVSGLTSLWSEPDAPPREGGG